MLVQSSSSRHITTSPHSSAHTNAPPRTPRGFDPLNSSSHHYRHRHPPPPSAHVIHPRHSPPLECPKHTTSHGISVRRAPLAQHTDTDARRRLAHAEHHRDDGSQTSRQQRQQRQGSDGDGEDTGGSRRPLGCAPSPFFPLPSLLTLQDLQLSWQLHPQPGVLCPYAHSVVLPNRISDVGTR